MGALKAIALDRLAYDAATGVLTWVRPRRSTFIGKPAGCVSHSGYVTVCLGRTPVPAHRIAWLLHYGEWPQYDIDHINGNRADNRIGNLRDVPRRINRENMRSAMPGSRSGLLGVRWHARDRLWYAAITVRGRRTILGYFKDASEAHQRYVEAKRQLHEGCTL
jgi:hypothetical protein